MQAVQTVYLYYIYLPVIKAQTILLLFHKFYNSKTRDLSGSSNSICAFAIQYSSYFLSQKSFICKSILVVELISELYVYEDFEVVFRTHDWIEWAGIARQIRQTLDSVVLIVILNGIFSFYNVNPSSLKQKYYLIIKDKSSIIKLKYNKLY